MNEKQKNNLLRRSKGITLVALVVTIIVLIILAGVSISLVLGENGIITKSKFAKQETLNAQVEEQEKLNEVAEYLENMGETEDGTEEDGTEEDGTEEDGTEESESERYYGDASIEPSPAELFKFTVNEDEGTASIRVNYNLVEKEDIQGKPRYYHFKYNSTEVTKLVIPYEYEDTATGKKYLVTAIDGFGFNDSLSFVQTLIIPNSITTIGEYSFHGMGRGNGGLTTVTIPSSVTSIGYDAFGFCENLTTVYFEAEGTTPTFGNDCFKNTQAITFYFRDQRVYDAFTEYNTETGTKSTNFNW